MTVIMPYTVMVDITFLEMRINKRGEQSPHYTYEEKMKEVQPPEREVPLLEVVKEILKAIPAGTDNDTAGCALIAILAGTAKINGIDREKFEEMFKETFDFYWEFFEEKGFS